MTENSEDILKEYTRLKEENIVMDDALKTIYLQSHGEIFKIAEKALWKMHNIYLKYHSEKK